MQIDKSKYVTNKKVQIYPGDTYSKFGYIRDVDELGFTYEVTEATHHADLGVYFVNHACQFTYKEIE